MGGYAFEKLFTPPLKLLMARIHLWTERWKESIYNTWKCEELLDELPCLWEILPLKCLCAPPPISEQWIRHWRTIQCWRHPFVSTLSRTTISYTKTNACMQMYSEMFAEVSIPRIGLKYSGLFPLFHKEFNPQSQFHGRISRRFLGTISWQEASIVNWHETSLRYIRIYSLLLPQHRNVSEGDASFPSFHILWSHYRKTYNKAGSQTAVVKTIFFSVEAGLELR